MKGLIQSILWLFSVLATLAALAVFLFIGFKVLAYVFLPLVVLWLIIGAISWLLSGKKRDREQGPGTGETLDIPPEDYRSTSLKE